MGRTQIWHPKNIIALDLFHYVWYLNRTKRVLKLELLTSGIFFGTILKNHGLIPDYYARTDLWRYWKLTSQNRGPCASRSKSIAFNHKHPKVCVYFRKGRKSIYTDMGKSNPCISLSAWKSKWNGRFFGHCIQPQTNLLNNMIKKFVN